MFARALGHQNGNQNINRHINVEDNQLSQKYRFGIFGLTLKISNRTLIIINKSGVYSLILDSQLPKAKKPRHWQCQADCISRES
ncbi:MAG: Bro-N domain-containing protein [Selenomonadaceae bacterium]|nr:Bro-N domain-containing protein [Selenomonadaceae bacterium]